LVVPVLTGTVSPLLQMHSSLLLLLDTLCCGTQLIPTLVRCLCAAYHHLDLESARRLLGIGWRNEVIVKSNGNESFRFVSVSEAYSIALSFLSLHPLHFEVLVARSISVLRFSAFCPLWSFAAPDTPDTPCIGFSLPRKKVTYLLFEALLLLVRSLFALGR